MVSETVQIVFVKYNHRARKNQISKPLRLTFYSRYNRDTQLWPPREARKEDVNFITGYEEEVVIVTPKADGAENLDRCNLESHNVAPNTKLSPFAFPSKNGEMQEQEVTECNILPNDTLSQKVRFHRIKVTEKSCRRSVSGRQDLWTFLVLAFFGINELKYFLIQNNDQKNTLEEDQSKKRECDNNPHSYSNWISNCC